MGMKNIDEDRKAKINRAIEEYNKSIDDEGASEEELETIWKDAKKRNDGKSIFEKSDK